MSTHPNCQRLAEHLISLRANQEALEHHMFVFSYLLANRQADRIPFQESLIDAVRRAVEADEPARVALIAGAIAELGIDRADASLADLSNELRAQGDTALAAVFDSHRDALIELNALTQAHSETIAMLNDSYLAATTEAAELAGAALPGNAGAVEWSI